MIVLVLDLHFDNDELEDEYNVWRQNARDRRSEENLLGNRDTRKEVIGKSMIN